MRFVPIIVLDKGEKYGPIRTADPEFNLDDELELSGKVKNFDMNTLVAALPELHSKELESSSIAVDQELHGHEFDDFKLELSGKKKRNKKVTNFDITPLPELLSKESSSAVDQESHGHDPDDFNLELLGKKKRTKKIKKFDMNTLDAALPEIHSKEAESAVNQDEPQGHDKPEDFNFDMDFSMFKKKKKKKKELEDEIKTDCVVKEKTQAADIDEEASAPSWVGSDRDYTYDELLTRVYHVMQEKNPNMHTGKKQKFVMKPPQIARVGSKKTSFVNFAEVCTTLHRQPKHLLDFLLAELGTCGSVDGNDQLVIKGRFLPKQIEIVLRRYIKEYVICHTCRSSDTILQKNTRICFLQCETCGSRCSVASIKSGFQAVTGKRAALRARKT